LGFKVKSKPFVYQGMGVKCLYIRVWCKNPNPKLYTKVGIGGVWDLGMVREMDRNIK